MELKYKSAVVPYGSPLTGAEKPEVPVAGDKSDNPWQDLMQWLRPPVNQHIGRLWLNTAEL